MSREPKLLQIFFFFTTVLRYDQKVICDVLANDMEAFLNMEDWL